MRFVVSILIFVLSALAHANSNSGISFSETKLAPGLYMLQGQGGFTGGNIALLFGDDGVVMIDDSMPPFFEDLKKKIKSLTGKSVDFLINTHVHGDHVGNNASFAQTGVYIVGHENMRKQMLERGVPARGVVKKVPREALPVVTFSESVTFHLNGEQIHIIHLPTAHTDGDAVIHFLKSNVIHTGDIFFEGRFPYIDVSSGGRIKGYISAQKKIIGMANADTKIIPGHGKLTDREQLKESVAMLEDIVSRVEPLVKAGKTENEVVEINPLRIYENHSWGFISVEKMTRQTFQSLASH